jgi:hypothetical protein
MGHPFTHTQAKPVCVGARQALANIPFFTRSSAISAKARAPGFKKVGIL